MQRRLSKSLLLLATIAGLVMISGLGHADEPDQTESGDTASDTAPAPADEDGEAVEEDKESGTSEEDETTAAPAVPSENDTASETTTPSPEEDDATLDADDELERLIEEASQESNLGGWNDREAERPASFPRLDHHGYFRFRADLFWNGHLGTVEPGNSGSGTSAIPAPLNWNAANNSDTAPTNAVGADDSRTLAGANIRFRYQPTFHISQSVRVKATFDILDNLVLGSTPDFAGNLSRPDVPLVAFSGGQAPPSAGVNGFRDAVRVKEAYAEWQPAFLLRVGRMASHWGMGILANGGQGIDSDYGDYADRILMALKVYGIYVVGAYDFVWSGATTEDPGDFFGQAKDLGTADDVKQAVVSIFQRPLSAEEKSRREARFREELEPIFDWGLYTIYREQEVDLDTESYELLMEHGGDARYGSLGLVARNAWAVVPDLWLRYQQRFDYFSGLRVELEAAAIIGEMENAVDDSGFREFQQFGAALEVEYDWKELTVGLDAGFATGDSAEGFGVEDGNTIADGDQPNIEINNFKFDRDYHIDLLLFREVIGTVTNTVYIKPYVAWDLFDSFEDALGARLDLLYAQALEPSATPGNNAFLGFEADLRLFYEEKGRFNLDLEAGLLVPGEAFSCTDGCTAPLLPELAFTFQSRLTLQF